MKRLEMENERLRHDLERSQVSRETFCISIVIVTTMLINPRIPVHAQPYVTTAFGRNALSASQDLDRIQDRADKTSSELRRTEAELRVTRVSTSWRGFHYQL